MNIDRILVSCALAVSCLTPGSARGQVEGQGKAANGGALEYVVDGEMTRGFALVAWPVHYEESGVMTFIVNQDGVGYERDLGPETKAAVEKLTRYDPDEGWRPVQAGSGRP